ncbi:MAG: fluoride efflux transporter CrcB [Anaerolineae bacterium]|nr:fluoride efflux transporter CrcB [Anaerolineae bacterium]
MATFVWIGLGGFLGANARYWLGLWLADRLGTAFPYGTLVANALGSFALAFLLTLVTGRVSAPPGARPFLAIGFLGGFTTFSSFSYETLRLLEQNAWGTAFWNVTANTGLGLLGAFLGIVVARWLQRGG